MKISDSDHILITDVGSTTTKGLLLSKKGTKYVFSAALDVPTTVEKPTEDVKIGVIDAARELEVKAGVKLFEDEKEIKVPYLTTSSAGGGLQILVFGLSAVETGRTAEMTAYGAGGVILHTFTIDDLTSPVQKMRMMHELHPDMVLMAGGVDGGAIAGVVRLAELLTLADPSPKFRQAEKIPLVFCGNVDAREFLKDVLEDNFEIHITANIRPSMEEMNVGPAKTKVHELFMENVMERAPGYAELKNWVAADILPTPAGVEEILELYGKEHKINTLMVDMGGATTDIFSNILGFYHRTVAANIGMSYSISNVLAEVGIERIMRHLPDDSSEDDVRNYIANKMLNPTYVPQHPCERLAEQAVAIEGIRYAWSQHQEMNFEMTKIGRLDARRLRKDVNKFEELFYLDPKTYFQPSDINLVIGSGGVLSHAQSKEEALWMLAEGFLPSGVTKLAVDKGFKSPHLGVLSKEDPELALELFTEQCLEEVGYLISPVGDLSKERQALTVKEQREGKTYRLKGGDFLYLANGGGVEIIPGKNVCLDKNKDKVAFKTDLPVLVDCRGRGEDMLDKPMSKSELWTFPEEAGEWQTEVRKSVPKISSGTYSVERRLPYEGEIYVNQGDRVEPRQVIGENRFAPPRLYIIDLHKKVGYDKKLSEEELKEGLLVKEGDTISLGQRVFKGHGTMGIPYFVSSTVRGKITKIEKGGLIVLREIQDYDAKPHVVDVAGPLEEKPGHIKGYLKFKEGDFVEAGRILAQKLQDKAYVKAPSTGVLKEIDTDKGTVTIQYDLEPVPLHAFIKGVAKQVKKGRGVLIEGRGSTLYGIIGFGGEASGELMSFDSPSELSDKAKGKMVAVSNPVSEEFLRKASEIGVSGIIAPSINNLEWVKFFGREIGVALTGEEDIPFTLILTEGFGEFPMNAEYREFFTKSEGKLASISGRTQIRAGVTRPRVIVSEE